MADTPTILTMSDCVPEDKAKREEHYHSIARFAVYLNRARTDMQIEKLDEAKMIIGVPFPHCIIYLMYAAAFAEKEGFDMNAAIDKWGKVVDESPNGEDTRH